MLSLARSLRSVGRLSKELGVATQNGWSFAATQSFVRRCNSNRADLKYSEKHEWIRVNGNQGVVGITDYAQVKRTLLCL